MAETERVSFALMYRVHDLSTSAQRTDFALAVVSLAVDKKIVWFSVTLSVINLCVEKDVHCNYQLACEMDRVGRGKQWEVLAL